MWRVPFAVILVAILIAENTVDVIGTLPPLPTFESVRAAQEKFDREMKQDTKRPWDNMDLTGPRALEKRQPSTEGRAPVSK
jgi:hypothetical protein